MVAHTRPTLIYHNFWPRANANARIAALKRACYELLGMMLSLPQLIPSKIGHILEVSVTKNLQECMKYYDIFHPNRNDITVVRVSLSRNWNRNNFDYRSLPKLHKSFLGISRIEVKLHLYFDLARCGGASWRAAGLILDASKVILDLKPHRGPPWWYEWTL